MFDSPHDFIQLIIVASIILMLLFFGIILIFLVLFKNKQLNDRKRIFELTARHEQMLLAAKLEIQDSTFQRVSQEIHDNIGQKLSLVKLLLSRQAFRDLDDIRDLVSEAIDSLRQVSRALIKDSVLEDGLLTAMHSEISRISTSGLYNITVRSHGDERFFKDEVELVLLRIFQESIQNIVKHSRANKITIEFFYGLSDFKIAIHDNGEGLKKNLVEGLGMKNMRDRAKLFNGIATICSADNGGTTVTVKFPSSIYSNEN